MSSISTAAHESFGWSGERLVREFQKLREDNARLKDENEKLHSKIAALKAAGDEMADTLNSTYTRDVRESNLKDWREAKGLDASEKVDVAERLALLEDSVGNIWYAIKALEKDVNGNGGCCGRGD